MPIMVSLLSRVLAQAYSGRERSVSEYRSLYSGGFAREDNRFLPLVSSDAGEAVVAVA